MNLYGEINLSPLGSDLFQDGLVVRGMLLEWLMSNPTAHPGGRMGPRK